MSVRQRPVYQHVKSIRKRLMSVYQRLHVGSLTSKTLFKRLENVRLSLSHAILKMRWFTDGWPIVCINLPRLLFVEYETPVESLY